MEKIKELITDLAISALIGILVGGSYLMVILSKYIGKKEVLISLIMSAIIGIIIGSTARFVFNLIRFNVIKKVKIAYILEILVVAIMTGLASYFMGVREFRFLFLMILIASTLAFLFTLSQERNYKKINKKLQDFQDEVGNA